MAKRLFCIKGRKEKERLNVMCDTWLEPKSEQLKGKYSHKKTLWEDVKKKRIYRVYLIILLMAILILLGVVRVS